MDLVHSHAVRNEVEGLACYDGSRTLFFHEGPRGDHPAWDSLCFDYGRNNVIHFLLSNCKYWLEVFQFDGFRFDGCLLDAVLQPRPRRVLHLVL